MKKDSGAGKKKVRFEMSVTNGAKAYVAGSFNNWTPLELSRNILNGKLGRTVQLPQGRHEYKFIVDGAWLPDAANPRSTVNSFGSLNSVIEV